jgi:hypothetical protein
MAGSGQTGALPGPGRGCNLSLVATTLIDLPEQLVAKARESAGPGRTVSAQIEHWATLGSEVEAFLVTENLGRRDRAPAPATPVSIEAIEALLSSIADSSDRSRVRAEIESRGFPLYEADADDPNLIVQVEADGRRTRGRYLNRQFSPLE